MSERVDGCLDATGEHRLEEHLAGCAACRRELVELQETVASIRALPRVAAPPNMVEQVRLRLPGRRWSFTEFVSLPQTRMAFAAGLILILTLYGVRTMMPPSAQEASDAVRPVAEEAPAPSEPMPVPIATAMDEKPAAAAGAVRLKDERSGPIAADRKKSGSPDFAAKRGGIPAAAAPANEAGVTAMQEALRPETSYAGPARERRKGAEAQMSLGRAAPAKSVFGYDKDDRLRAGHPAPPPMQTVDAASALKEGEEAQQEARSSGLNQAVVGTPAVLPASQAEARGDVSSRITNSVIIRVRNFDEALAQIRRASVRVFEQAPRDASRLLKNTTTTRERLSGTPRPAEIQGSSQDRTKSLAEAGPVQRVDEGSFKAAAEAAAETPVPGSTHSQVVVVADIGAAEYDDLLARLTADGEPPAAMSRNMNVSGRMAQVAAQNVALEKQAPSDQRYLVRFTLVPFKGPVAGK